MEVTKYGLIYMYISHLTNLIWSFEGEAPTKKVQKRKIVYCFDDEGYLLKEFENTTNVAEYYQVPVWQVRVYAGKNRRRRANDILIFTCELFVDWKYYKLKHKNLKVQRLSIRSNKII